MARPGLIALPWIDPPTIEDDIPDFSEDFERLFFLEEDMLSSAVVPMHIALPQAAYESAMDAIMRIYTCPICLDYMYPAFLDCGQGHHFCGSCVRKVSSCPFCRSKKAVRRLKDLEDAAELLHFPCVYSGNGCKRIIHLTEWNEHSKNCIHKRL